MKNINLGKISIPLDDYASQGNAILGIRDSGKSYTATAIAERLMDRGIPIIAFDPIGIWRNLRVPGSGNGYKVVVAGGRNGDLPLTARGAQEIVRAAMRENVSLIVDLYDIHLSKADWREVVGSSIRTLLYENGDHGLRHIFIEEAAEFCPQVISPDQGRVYAEVEKLARMGGNALLGYTLINQRAEQVNKAVLELCDCMILHRQKGRNSITALSKWLDIASTHDSKALISSLPGLAQGECWVWPAGAEAPVRTRIPTKNSFHPDRRARQAPAKANGREVDVSAFVATMRTSLDALTKEVEANDPKLLRQRIAELEREARKAPAVPAIDPQAIGQAEQRGHMRGKIEGYREGLAAFPGDPLARIDRLLDDFGTSLKDFRRDIDAWQARQPDAPAVPRRQQTTAPAPARAAPRRQTSGNGTTMPKAERLILTALAQYPQGRSKSQAAVLTGYSGNGGGFNNAVSALRSAGRINGSVHLLTITQAGLDALGSYEPLPHGEALLQHWLRQLGKAERAALEVLVQAYPKALIKDIVGARAGYEPNGGGFNNAISRLRSLELISGRGELRASHDLFG